MIILQFVYPFFEQGKLKLLVAINLVFRVTLEDLVHLFGRNEFGPWSLFVNSIAFHYLIVAVLLNLNHLLKRQL